LIRKVVIPAGGHGTRLLPVTKEMPKEMLPIFSSGIQNNLVVRPLLQIVFEQLYDIGLREFCFVVGKGKDSISRHFTYDPIFIRFLEEEGKTELSKDLSHFYNMIKASSLVFVFQTEPKGFGDAVLKAEPFIKEPFLVQAGDTLILSEKNKHLSKLVRVQEEYDSAAVFFVKKVENPKPFGIIDGTKLEGSLYKVKTVIEKPENPTSNLAIAAYYIFTPQIFSALNSINLGLGGELQLTDGIQHLIDSGLEVLAVELEQDEYWIDVGSPTTYWTALYESHTFNQKSVK
jgi:UTP--glucose-1-phosphate uridylyltransferase